MESTATEPEIAATEIPPASTWHCYLLESTDGRRTYVGATVNPARRLRQHNGEIAGGAKATKGRKWVRRFLVGGFKDERTALQFEWYWKYHTRTGAPGNTFMERRMHALSLLLANYPDAFILECNLAATFV